MDIKDITEVIKTVGGILVPIVGAYLAYKISKLTVAQAKIGEKQEVIHSQIDGMKTELVEAVKGRGRAEGQLIGIEKAKQEAIDTAEVQPVKIVEQTKTIDVTIKKKDK